MGANVLQRREEIGLMKAIGATRREISSFYLLEMTLIGTIGGVSGFLFGFIMSQAISQGAFNSFIDIPMYMPLFSIITGILLSLLSACFPVLNALKYNPAVVLREE
jgi:putative ABC transport system permease protein